MTVKDKASELVEKYKLLDYNSNLCIEKSKKCALIAVDEIKKAISHKDDFDYWQEVKTEIEKL